MRLHLPFSLRKYLLLAISTVAATLGSQTADAAVLFDGVGLQTYADFGQNCGRYVAGEVNAMLQAIRERDGGIVITYQSDAYDSYTIPLEQGMIDFSSASSTPVDAAVGYGFLATVAHNGAINPTYTANDVGGQNAIHYISVDFKRGTNFHMEAATDYKVSRLNKLVTDAQPSELYSGADPSVLDGEYLYRTGSGAMELALIDDDGVWRRTQELEVPYTFATGGIVVVEWTDNPKHEGDHDANFGIFHHVNPKVAEEIAAQPLPYRVRSGDSGSPTWVYNETTGTYQYISAAQSGGQYFNQDRGDLVWSKYAMEKFNVTPDLGTSDEAHSITLSAVNAPGEKISGVGDDVEVSTIPYSGTLSFTNAQGQQESKTFIGVQSGMHTWKALNPIKDTANWFNYGDAYFNAAKYGTDSNPDKQFSYADLFVTNSLVFKAADDKTYNVELEADVDLGIGFVQFGKAEGVKTANFKLQSEHLLESAGFAIDEGVTLELDMKATEARMVEWRKAGAGDLTITGEGNTNALLNVGGSGTVSLKRTGGYAAYNVLVSSGSTVVIDNLQQVYRDVTLGANGATLDLNGNNFTWNNSAEADGNGFKSLHLLMEKDIVTNTANKAVTITITDPGTEAFVGAFRDTKEGAIIVEYNGNSENPWVMNTVFTNLQNHDASSFTVNQGGVVLQGINTIHGKQVLGKRPVNEFDWHYADAQMDVVISSGAEFTLGSHARLKGDVTVKDGGVFNMTEYTTHQYEYVEGGVKMDDTYKLRDYYGLHGNVNLEGENSMFRVAFSTENHFENTDSESVYGGLIYGNGGMTVDTAGGSLRLTNTGNSFKGTKSLEGGTLVAEGLGALGDTTNNRWFIKDRGVLIVENAGLNDILPKILGKYQENTPDGIKTYYSNGVLALTQDFEGESAPDLSGFQQLIIGAVEEVQFGKQGTSSALAANNNNEWHLGGGGGNLVVNYSLNNENGVLVLGNQYTTGTVTLTNTENHFKRIDLVGGVTFVCKDDRALGGADVDLKYANRLMGSSTIIDSVTGDSEGAILLDDMGGDASVNLSEHGKLSLATSKKMVFSGNINLGDNDTYHFGGGGGHLVLETVLMDGEKGARNVVVDGQFCKSNYTGDEEENAVGEVIELKHALGITGDLTLQGYDENRIPGGDPLYVLHNASIVTLQLSVDNALENVGTVYMNDCAFIDINGTKQTLNSLVTPVSYETYMGTMGVVDNSDEQKGELVLNVVEDEEYDRWGGAVWAYLGAPTITKIGTGTLMLMNAVESNLFDIRQGVVMVATNKALSSGGITRVAGGAVLDVSEVSDGALENKHIELNGGTMIVGSDAITGRITATEDTGSIVAADGAANLYATIGARENATLALQGDPFILRADQNNTEGGIIDLQGVTLSLNNASGISIGGTLKVSQDATMANASAAGASHTIDRVDVNGQTLTISNNNQAVRWDINALNGSGTVVMQPGNGASTLHLNGPGSFSGELQVEGGVDGTPGLVLAHDNAAQHATINLVNNGAMALNTANAHIGGLDGDATGKVFAYKPAGEDSTPVQGATLTTTGSGQYVYGGAVTAVDGTRINLAMAGEGSQTYSGQVDVQDVSALNGTLNLQGSGIHIAGNVTVARGATLSVGNGLTLGSGQYLCSAGVSGKAGIVDSAVTFNGGGMRFDAGELLDNSNTPALHFGNGVTVGQDQQVVVDFINTSTLSAGSVLTLTSGHAWNTNLLTAEGVDYLEAAFSVQDNILKVSFSQKAGNRIWDGTTTQHAWSLSEFGQGGSFTSTDKAVFNDSAASTDVQVTNEVSAAALLFDNSKEYTVNTTENGMLSTEEVILNGAGVVTLGAGVSITQKADIAAGSTLVLRDTHTLETNARVDGAGTIALDTAETAYLDGKLTHIGSVEVRGGTLVLTKSLAADDLVLNEGTKIASSTSSILDNNATVHSAGTITIEVGSGKTETLTNAIAAGQSGAGTFVKVGAGTLNVTQSLVADTVRVEHGSLRTSSTSIVPDFLATTKLLEVDSGATAYIGGNAYTIPDRPVATDMVVDGGTLELAIAQNTTRTISGDLTINSGKLQKVDGGLIFTGTTTLGKSIADQVTLAGNWGKSGTIFNGLVQGEGKVTLAKGNSVEKFTFNNAENTFSGEIKATAGTQLVAGHKTALAQASNINLENNSTLVLATGEVDIKSLNGSGSVEFTAADASSSTTLNITNDGTFAGAVGGNISISKSGTGTFALTGESSQFNGDLYVKEGTMSLESGALGMLGSASSVTVIDGAAFQLGGDASVVGPMDIQGTLSLGGNITSRDSVQLAATSRLAGGSHILDASSLVIEGLGGTNVETAASQTLGAGSSLTMFGDPTTSITLQAAAEAMIYVVNNVQDVTLTGDSLTINLSGLGQTPQPGQWMGITLGDTASMDTGLLVECVIGDGQKMQGYYLSSSSGSSDYVYFQMEGVVIQDLIWDNATSNSHWSTSTDGANWHTADAPTNHVPFTQEANVTFESNAGTAVLQENITTGEMVLQDGANLTVDTAGHNLTVSDLDSSGSNFVKSGAGKVLFGNSDGEEVTQGMLTVNEGIVAFNDDVKIDRITGAGTTGVAVVEGKGAITVTNTTEDHGVELGSGKHLTLLTENLSTKTIYNNGNLTVGDGTTPVLVKTEYFVNGNIKDRTNPTGFDIKAGATVAVSGGDNENNTHQTGLVLSEWQNVTTGNVSGKLLAKNATLLGGKDDAFTLNIENGGIVAVKGIKSRGSKAYSVNLKDGGSLILGGTTSANANGTLNAAAGSTIGISAETASYNGTVATTAAGSKTVTIDTARYAFNGDGTDISKGTEGGTLILSGTISGDGNITKVGAGTLALNAANTYSGGTTVDAGTLVASNASALGSGAVTLNGGTLDLATAVTTGAFTMNSGTLALDGENWITSTGALALNSGTLDLTGMSITSGHDYTLATGTSVTLNPGVTLTLAQELQEHYKLTTNGSTLMLTFIQPAPTRALIWDGTTNSNWSNSTDDCNWHTEGGQAGSNSFMEEADVFFASGSASVTLTDNIVAGDATFAAGAHVAISNGGEFEQVFTNVTIEEGASVSFNENCSTFITDTLALNGTVTNSGYLEIASGTVAAGATGVLAGEGMTYLLGEISNAGTVKLDHATLAGADEAAITGNVVINGGVLLGTMILGSEDSTVSVTEAFIISGDAEYTVLGDVKLDNLSGAEFYYAEGEQDVYNNGFFIGMDVTVFTMEYDPEIGTPIDFRGTVTYKGMEGKIEYGVFTAYVEDYTTFHVNTVTDTAECYSHAREAGGEVFTTVALADGTSFNMDSEDASLAHVIVEDGAAASVNIASTSTIGDVQVGDGLTFTGNAGTLQLGSVQGSGSLTVDGPTVTITGNNASYTGDIVVNSGTLKAGNNNALGSMNAADHTIRVQTNGTLDVNGLEGTGDGYTVVLAGGTLTNSGGDLGYGKRQLVTHVSLTADSKIAAAKEFGITGGSYAATSVALGAYTLEKTGTGTFHIQNATVTGTGKIKVSEGTLAMSTGPNAGAGSYSANFEMAGGTVSGKVALGGNIAVETTADSSFGATMNLGAHTATFSGDRDLNATGNISDSGKLVKIGGGILTVGGANNYSGGTAINGGTLVTNNTSALGTGNVDIAEGATLQTRSNLTVGGVISGSGNILADGGGTVTFNAANTFTGNLTVRGVLNELGEVTATTTLKMGNNAALGAEAASITIGKGGIVNLNGTSDVCYKYTLDGGALLNNGNGTNTGNKQTAGLTLTDNSTFGGSGNFKLLNSGYAAIDVKLGGNTLTKTGNNTVGFYTTTFDEGTLEVQGGKIEFNDGNKGANTFSKSAEMVLNVTDSGDTDRVSGQVNVTEGLALQAKQSAKVSVAVSLSDNAALTTGAEANQTLNMTGAVSGGASTTLGKTGEGTANLSGNTAGFHGSVDVEAGVLNILNAASVDVKDVTIGANSTLGVYNGSTATADTEHEGTLTIKNAQSLTAKGTGATLNANVVMETGSTLDVSATGGAGLMLGSALTLNTGMDLSEADYANVARLLKGETYVLFEGVDALKLGTTSYEEIIPEQVDAAEYYKGLESGSYYLVYNYNGNNVGQVAIFSTVPEPATGTLSLLALAALAARRRRK